MRIYKKLHFNSAHKLKLDYKSKCENLHGHTWTVEFWIEGIRGSNGIVYDFNNLTKIIDNFDHKILNDVFSYNPTAENLAIYLAQDVYKQNGIHQVKCRVWESPTAYAEYETRNKNGSK